MSVISITHISKIPPPCADFQGTHECSAALCADSDTDIQPKRETTMESMDVLVNIFKPFIKILLFLTDFHEVPAASCVMWKYPVPNFAHIG